MRHLPVCVKLLEPSGALFLSSAGGSLFTLRDVLDARHSNVARGAGRGASCPRVSRHRDGCPVPVWWNGRRAGFKIRTAQNTTSRVKRVARGYAPCIKRVQALHPKKNDLATCTQGHRNVAQTGATRRY